MVAGEVYKCIEGHLNHFESRKAIETFSGFVNKKQKKIAISITLKAERQLRLLEIGLVGGVAALISIILKAERWAVISIEIGATAHKVSKKH